jgi:hypothetical protein
MSEPFIDHEGVRDEHDYQRAQWVLNQLYDMALRSYKVSIDTETMKLPTPVVQALIDALIIPIHDTDPEVVLKEIQSRRIRIGDVAELLPQPGALKSLPPPKYEMPKEEGTDDGGGETAVTD